MRQLEPLMMIRMFNLRSFQACLDLWQRDSQQPGRLAQRHKFFPEGAIAQPFEPLRAFALAADILRFKLLWFPGPPASCDGLESIGQNGRVDHADLFEAHEQRCPADAVEPFQGDELLVSQGVALLAYLAQEVFAWHQERSGEEIGGSLFLFIGKAGRIEDAMGEFVRQSQPAALEGKLPIIDDDRQSRRPFLPRHNASEARDSFGQVYDEDFKTFLFEQLGHVRDGIGSEHPFRADFAGQLFRIFDPFQFSRNGEGRLTLRAVQVKNVLDLEVAFDPFEDFGFNGGSVFGGGTVLGAELDAGEHESLSVREIGEHFRRAATALWSLVANDNDIAPSESCSVRGPSASVLQN